MTGARTGRWVLARSAALWIGLVLLAAAVTAAQFAGFLVALLLILLGGIVLAVLAAESVFQRRAVRARPAPVLAPAVEPAATPIGAAEVPEMKEGMARDKLVLFLREVDVFQSLTDHELGMIASISEPRSFSDGEVLAREGSRGEHLFVIMKGQVRVGSTNEGERLTVRVAQEKESLPLAALLEPPILITTAEAMGTVEALAVPREKLLRLCEVQPLLGVHLFRAIAGVLAGRYRKTLGQLSEQLAETLRYLGMRAA